MESAFRDWYSWVWPIGFLAAAVLLALLAHRILFAVLSA
jgi:hypothetical protein